MRRPIHCLVYGESGSGKSSFARTFPKPMLVLNFDSIDHAEIYYELGDVADIGPSGGRVFSKRTGKLLVQLENFHDAVDEAEMQRNSACTRFWARLRTIRKEFPQWSTVVFDSASYMELIFRKHDQYVTNKGVTDRRQFKKTSTFALEDLLKYQLLGWPMNVVVTAHTDYDKAQGDSGVLRYKPKMPGITLLSDIGGAFGEYYHAFVKETEGEKEYLLQTQNRGLFSAASRIHAPDPCAAHYGELWANQPPEQDQHEQQGVKADLGTDQGDGSK